MLTSRNAGTASSFNTQYYLNVYLALGIASTVLVTARALFIAFHRVAASRAIHANLVARVLRAPIALFDATPIGRLLNRFSRDVDVVDSELAPSIAQVLGTLFNVFGSLCAIAVATKGVFLAPAIPLLWAFR
jgi:ABC-type multidrug transport system fused ATPase/permease subunit